MLGLLLVACASGPPLTEEEKVYNRQMDRENWILCELIMEQQGVVQAVHNHHHGRNDMYLKPWMVKQDLIGNHCRMRLGALWADGY